MTNRTQTVLELEKILKMLSDRAASDITKQDILKMEPFKDPRIIKEKLTETSEAVSVIMQKGAPPIGNIPDLKDRAMYASKGGVLTMADLIAVSRHIKIAGDIKVFLKSDIPPVRIISEIVSVIEADKKLGNDITNAILSDSEMADNASTELRKIRRSMDLKNESIRSKMNQMVNSSSNKDKLQDQLVTMRGGRYVIPVKQEHKSSFPGIVHDQSKAGATLFIEPQAIVNLNNELRELELAERKEINRILAEFSKRVGLISHELINNQQLIVDLDMIFAKGKLSADLISTEPEINTEGQLRIKNGRHPLIDAEKVVPISLELGRNYKTLIITGPNTGGKTVTLKTIGLFVLMTEMGLHVPADAGTQMPVTEKVYADIGDEQSIEQSLSTFSSHMKNIVEIVNEADSDSLVLLDELGAGTDPTEGAALAMSILEYLRTKECLTVATTHYTELKKYAIGTEGVENASMEFNVDTLSPTYKLSVGTPGRSNAFEISGKLGLPENIRERAKKYLDGADIKFETILDSIENDRRHAEEDRDEALKLKLMIQNQKAEFDKKLNDMQEKRDKVIRKAKEEARDIIEEAQDFSDKIKEELKEIEDIPDRGDRLRTLSEKNKEIKKADGKYRDTIEKKVSVKKLKPGEVKVGDIVRLLNLDQDAEVLSVNDKTNKIQVQAGPMKMTTSIENLALVEDGAKKKSFNKSSQYGSIVRKKHISVRPEIDVRGENLDSAVSQVEKYLDDAFIAGLDHVTIIHGRGEGILREGLNTVLKKNKHVSKTRYGAHNEGGDGVTIVTIGE